MDNKTYDCEQYYFKILTNFFFDTFLNGHYHQITNLQFKEIQELSSNLAQMQRSTELELRSLGPLYPYLHDRHIYVPQDPYHAVAGKVARFLECSQCTCSILTL